MRMETTRISLGSSGLHLLGGNPVMSAMERPVLIGKPIPRPGVRRFLRGRGRYVGDISLPRMVHLVFVRSPHAHARIVSIDSEAAKRAPGVALIATGAEVAAQCKPFITDGVAQNRPGHKVPPQQVMVVDVAHYQGQPVAAVLAETRAQAEDA